MAGTGPAMQDNSRSDRAPGSTPVTHEAVALLRRCIGKPVICPGGQRVGHVEDLFLDVRTGSPGWFAVRRSGIRRKLLPVPFADARITAKAIETPHGRRQVFAAPGFPRHHGLTRGEARLVRQYWTALQP